MCWRKLISRLDTLEDVTTRIASTLVAEPPLTMADGGAIAAGVDAELDDLRAISSTGRQSIAAIEERERARTGIGSLKVRYNSVFGYYIEITKSNLAMAPADYERKQTLVNAERFTTPELKEYEVKILTAHDRCIEIEKRILSELRTQRVAGGGQDPAGLVCSRRGGSADQLCAPCGAAALRSPRADRGTGAGSGRGAASGNRAVDGGYPRRTFHCQRSLSQRQRKRPKPAADYRARTWAAKAPTCARRQCWC